MSIETENGNGAQRVEQDQEAEDAPYGRKADGTVRKRPAPSPEVIAARARSREANAAAKLAKAQKQTPKKRGRPKGSAKAKPSPKARPVAKAAPKARSEQSDFVGRIVADLDAEIARLQSARAALTK